MKAYVLTGIACLTLIPASAHSTTFRQVRIPAYAAWNRYIDDIAIVDMNADGYADVVTLEGTNWKGSPSKLRVFLSGQTPVFNKEYNAKQDGMKPPIVGTADFTGDGKVDVAVKRGCFIIFPGKGNGGFLAAKPVTPSGPTVPVPTHWTTLDFDGDGKPDLAGRNSDGSMSAFRNLGQTQFEASTFGEGQLIATAAGGDFDGDGLADIVGGSGSTLRFFKSNGDGTFGTPVTSNAGENVGPHLMVADINGDGRPDLVGDSSSLSSPGWSMLGKGKGKFGSKKKFPGGPSLHYGCTLADYTADGNLDVAAPNGNGGIDLFQGLGKGGFVAMSRLASMFNFTSNSGTTSSNRNVAAGDVNGDGVADLAGIIWFPGDPFTTPTVLVYVTGGTPVVHSISSLSIPTLTYDPGERKVSLVGSVAFQHPQGDIRNGGSSENSGAFIEFTVVLDFGAGVVRSTTARFGGSWMTNYPGQTSGTISFNLGISNNTWPASSPQLSVRNFSLYDFNFVQSNVLP